jgi:hypothetical protein
MTVAPEASGGKVSVAMSAHPADPVAPRSPVCCHAAEPGEAVTGPPAVALATEDCGSP